MLSDGELTKLFGSRSSGKKAVGGNPYKDLGYLIVEDQDASRKSLQMSLQAMGGVRVAVAQNYFDAIARIRHSIPDVIVCDYILGSGRTGQLLLEELRRKEKLPESVVFVMVTAERSYEQVVAVVELIPDDYIIKPFSPEMLRTRLERAIRKKILFGEYYRAKAKVSYDEALQRLDAVVANDDAAPYRYEIMRCRADTLMAGDKVDEAISQYESILALHEFPWAKLGLARALRQKNRLAEARSAIEEVIGESPSYFEAYDLKADICSDQGDYAEAQETLTRISAMTPRNYRRKRALSMAATLNGDFDTARQVINDVILNDSVSAQAAADCLTLVRAAIDQNDLDAARNAMSMLPDSYLKASDEKTRRVCDCLSALLVHGSDEGDKLFARMRASIASHPPEDVESGVDAVRLALAYADIELADRVAIKLLLGADSKHAFHSLQSLFRSKGQEAHFRQLQKEVAGRMLSRKGGKE